MPGTVAVSLRGVSKSYGAVRALKGVDLDVHQGEVLGVVGENGAGKSTLIGVLSGTVRPEQGTMSLHGRQVAFGEARAQRSLGVSVVVQEQALVETMRVYETLFLGREAEVGGAPIGRAGRLRRRADQIFAELGIEVEAREHVAALTYPQRQMVEIAKAFVEGADAGGRGAVILLDEPTSALSEREVDILFELIERWRDRAAFIFVSHILNDVLRICTRLAVLRDGALIATVHNEDMTPGRLHELMVGTRRSDDYYCVADQTGPRDGPPVIELRNAGIAGVFDGVDLQVRPGEVLGIAGAVGSGADSLVGAIAGANRLTSGSVSVGQRSRRRWSIPDAIRNGVLYVPPERANDSVVPTMTIRQNIALGFLDQLRTPGTRLLSRSRERGRTAELARDLRVKTHSLDDPIQSLSGGNQQKVVLARWQGRRSVALVLHDPTRGIDVGTRHEIYELIRRLTAEGKAIVLFGESLEEVIGLSDRILVLKRGRVTAEIDSSALDKPTEIALVSEMT